MPAVRVPESDGLRGAPVRLSDLLASAGLVCAPQAGDPEITGISDNSQTIEPGQVFVAIRGTRTDSHLFVSDAVARGAAALVVEQEIPPYGSVPILRVENSREALGLMAHAFHGHPSRAMLVLGVTGTNGKTTTAYLLESILGAAGLEPGLIGTVESRFAGTTTEAGNTTPSARQLAELFAVMRDAGCRSVAMEVSSHALDQGRVAGIEFDGGVFTNLTQDHLDYHGTMEEYASVKERFFSDFLHRPRQKRQPASPAAVFNADDATGRAFAARHGDRAVTYGLDDGAQVRAVEVVTRPEGLHLELMVHGEPLVIESTLLGQFNVSNILAAVATADAVGIPREAIAAGVAALRAVPGRFEQVHAGQDFFVIVDYAHTPDALERVLDNARAMTSGQLITVFGCGGDRDARKRPLMGRAAGDRSDWAILTNDNPRTEDPELIAAMAEEGVRTSALARDRLRIVLDRREAIREAIGLAGPGDVVLIAGKGHENYQILGTGTVHFDDRETARDLLRERLTGPAAGKARD